MTEDLNQQLVELNQTLVATSREFSRQQTPERSDSATTVITAAATTSSSHTETQTESQTESHSEPKATENVDQSASFQALEEKYKSIVEQLEQRIDDLMREKNELVDENRRIIENMTSKLEQCQAYYENLSKQENEKWRAAFSNEEQQSNKLSRELARLKDHLVEMSDSYNKEAIQAEEREKLLRTQLSDAQNILQQQGANLETSSKEMEGRVEQLIQQNQELSGARDKLKEKLKQAEESFNHQVKVTKNLELVLERIQNGRIKI